MESLKSLMKTAVVAVVLTLVALGLLRLIGGENTKPPSFVASAPLQENPPAPSTIVRTFEGRLAFTPEHNAYTVTVWSDGKHVFEFDPPLRRTDGNLYGAMNDAIEAAYGKDAGRYFGEPLSLHTFPNGKRALAIVGDEYRYLALPLSVSDEDARVGVLAFWRERR